VTNVVSSDVGQFVAMYVCERFQKSLSKHNRR